MGYDGGNISDLVPDETATRDAVREMADAAGRFATERARELAPVGPPVETDRPPGTLRDSYRQIETHRVQHGVNAGYESGVVTHDYVARWAEWGVRSHTVEAKPGRWLRFRRWPDGKLIRAKIVHQRGYAGHHVVRDALLAAEVAFPEVAQPALERWRAQSSGR